ncbi:helix-turn-helix transcriptional regulator [Anaerosporobacter sp.]
MNRLFEILYILLQKRCITAKELADRFEVSVRTIYRDIDALSFAGVPVYTKKGRYGGIYLLDNYVFDKSLVSKSEQRDILAALESMAEVEKGSTDEILSKLRNIFQMGQPRWLAMDFSDWSNLKQELYANLKHAIVHHKRVEFQYYNRSGEVTERIVEPLQLWFKDYTWYLKAYCVKKKGLRVFKLNRIQMATVLEESFEEEYSKRIKCLEENQWGNVETYEQNLIQKADEIITITLLIDKSQGYRVYDNFETEFLTKLEDGNYLIKARYVLDNWVYEMILSYGKYVKVIEPEFVRENIRNRLLETLDLYKD